MKKENSLIYEMLRTPQQVQQEQLEKIRERSLKTMQARQANLSQDPIIGALQSGFADAGARAARILPEQRAAYGKAAGGLLSAASGLGVDPDNVTEQDKKRMSMLQNIGRDIERSQLTPEAQEAAKTQDLIKGIDTSTPEGLEALASKLDSVGRRAEAERVRVKARERMQQDREARAAEVQIKVGEAELQAIEDANAEQKTLAANISQTLDNLPDSVLDADEKNIIRGLPPMKAAEAVIQAKKTARATQKRNQVSEVISGMISGGEAGTGGTGNKLAKLNKGIAYARSQGQPELAEMLEGMLEAEQKTRDTEETLRDRLNKDDKLDNLSEVVANSNKMIQLLESGDVTGAKDLAAIFTFMKALDPQSTVRESEGEAASAVGGYLETIKSLGDRILAGEVLSAGARKQLVEASTMLGKTAAKTYNTQLESIKAAYDSRGYNANYITNVRPPLSVNTTPSKDDDAEKIGRGF